MTSAASRTRSQGSATWTATNSTADPMVKAQSSTLTAPTYDAGVAPAGTSGRRATNLARLS
jgi:hypothetical protein